MLFNQKLLNWKIVIFARKEKKNICVHVHSHIVSVYSLNDKNGGNKQQ